MKPHRTDMVSLTFSLIFLLISAWWLLARSFHLSLPKVGWFVAGALIVIGFLGVVGALRTHPTPPALSEEPTGAWGEPVPTMSTPADAPVTAPEEEADPGSRP